MGAYSGSLIPLRAVSSKPLPTAKQITSFTEFWADMAPSVLTHAQSFAVAVTSSGLVKGGADAYLSTKDPTSGS